MKLILSFLTLSSLIYLTIDESYATNVKGYIRKDGTYVAPHIRTNPNSTKLDNYSTQGNYNPYTGKTGTRSPYSTTRPKSYIPNYRAK